MLNVIKKKPNKKEGGDGKDGTAGGTAGGGAV
jgi:hypothetical protein